MLTWQSWWKNQRLQATADNCYKSQSNPKMTQGHKRTEKLFRCFFFCYTLSFWSRHKYRILHFNVWIIPLLRLVFCCIKRFWNRFLSFSDIKNVMRSLSLFKLFLVVSGVHKHRYFSCILLSLTFLALPFFCCLIYNAMVDNVSCKCITS